MTKRQPPEIYAGLTGALSSAWDRVVRMVAPVRAERMLEARVRSAVLLAAYYSAADHSRTNPKKRSASADQEMLPSLRDLRDSSRDLARNNDYVLSAADVWQDNVIGTGIVPLPMIDPKRAGVSDAQARDISQELSAYWWEWSHNYADATGVDDFEQLQAMIARMWFIEGEAFVLTVDGIDGEVSLQVIDPDRVESPSKTDSASYRGGVEVDGMGRPVAYHILPYHPDDAQLAPKVSNVARRHPATVNEMAMVHHLFARTRAGQTRGVPMTTAAIENSGHLSHYLRSELIAARAAAGISLWIKRTPTALDKDLFPVTPTESDGNLQYHETISAGLVNYMNEGEEPVAFSPNRPGQQFEPFVMRLLRGSAASMGLCYELISKDMGRLNYSSARSLFAEVRRGFTRARQRIVRMVCRPVYRNVVRRAVATGRIESIPRKLFAEAAEQFLACRWVAPAFGYVDPSVEVEAAAGSIANNLSSPYDEAQRNGLDLEQVMEDRAKAMARAREIAVKYGLPEDALLPPATSAGSPPAPRAKEDGEGDQKDGNDKKDGEDDSAVQTD